MYINKKVIWHTIEISHTVTCNENLTGELILNEGEKSIKTKLEIIQMTKFIVKNINAAIMIMSYMFK